MLGDTGSGSPGRQEISSLAGEMVNLPLMNRAIPIFADSYVDQEFGTER